MKLTSLDPRPCLALTLAAASLVGCSLTWDVGASNPAPNVLLARTSARLALHLAPTVDDAFPLPSTPASNLTVNVRGWRETMARGFQNSLAAYFAPAREAGQADLTLVIRLAVPFIPEQAQRVAVRFQAEVLDRQGRSIKQWADTVPSRLRYITDAHEMRRSLASAVESMYELIARDFPPAPAPVPPGYSSSSR